jgi:DNA-binding GntR family transcriptional regulator
MKIRSVDISQMASASSVIFEALRRAIIEGQLLEGESLRQDEIARRFNTSRIPVREALTRLEELGLVRTRRYKGAVVSGLSADEAVEIFDFRALIEPELIRRAVPRMTEAALAEARSGHQAFARSADPMDWGDLNRAFHTGLYLPSALGYHLEVLDNAMDRIDRYLRAQLLLSDGMARAIAEHNEILRACEAGDAALAAALTRQHIEGARASFLDHLQQLTGTPTGLARAGQPD